MPTWLVIAAVCDCPRVAVTVMDNWTPGSETAGPGELIAAGEDWRPLAEDLAVRLHRETGLPISGMCSTVHTTDREQSWPLTNELTDLCYALDDREKK